MVVGIGKVVAVGEGAAREFLEVADIDDNGIWVRAGTGALELYDMHDIKAVYKKEP